MANRPHDMSTLEVFRADLARIKALAAQLTEDGPGGRFGNPETIRWLLDKREQMDQALINAGMDASDVTP